LIESEPGRPSVSGQHIMLLDRRVETEFERRVPGHRDCTISDATDTTPIGDHA
jgi:hypothetical protein